MTVLYPLSTALLEGECLAPAISQMRVRVYEETFPNWVIEGIYTQSDGHIITEKLFMTVSLSANYHSPDSFHKSQSE